MELVDEMNRIKELRKLNKLTQAQLGEEVGVTKLTISRWEHGRNIKIEQAKKLAEILNTDINYLLNIEDKPTLPLLSKGKQYLIRMDELTIDLIRDCNRMSLQEVSDIKKSARNLYENLVRMQYEFEGREND